MSDKSFDIYLERGAEHRLSIVEHRLEKLAYLLYRLMDGDVSDPDPVYETLREYGFVDENHEWAYYED